MASTRAPAVAEVLWELKRADKIASFSAVADRAGFSAGANGRAMTTCLKTIRKEWSHLDWWRAVRDDGVIEDEEHAAELKGWGAELSDDGRQVSILIDESRIMVWDGADEAKQRSFAAAVQASK